VGSWIEEAQAKCDEATEGPWHGDPPGYCEYVFGLDGAMVCQMRGIGAEVSGERPEGEQEANRDFLIAARTDEPFALELIKQAVSLLEYALPPEGWRHDATWLARREAFLAAVRAGPR
jgi:hypothetical protein